MYVYCMHVRDFFHLADLLRPDIEADANAIRDVLTVEKKLAITLYYLKDQGSYLMTCNTFGIVKSTLSIVLKAVCRAINKRVGPAYLNCQKKRTRNAPFKSLAYLKYLAVLMARTFP